VPNHSGPDDLTPAERAAWHAHKRRALNRAVAWTRHRRVRAAQEATGTISRSHNRLEAQLASLLDEWEVDYQWQHRVGRYVYDFLLPGRLLVEVHGTYWHADPRFHDPARLSPTQRRNLARDADKACRAEAAGYRLIVVWEHDLRQGRVTREFLLGSSGPAPCR
jgi:G:T-mismatch repair DNA endonuclease (very short patch repair protein)